MTSIQIHNKIADLQEQAAVAIKEERIEDAHKIDGQIAAYNEQLAEQLKVEDEMRNDGVIPVTVEPEEKPVDVVEAFLGNRADFRGLSDEMKKNITNEVAGIQTPVRTVRDIPGITPEEHSFLDTLAKGTTDADIRFLQAVSYENNAGIWTSGQKAESDYTWIEASAPLTTIAHYTPIAKRMLDHYGQLESVIRNELFVGLENAKDKAALFANETNGMKGVTVQGVAYTPVAGDNLYDAILRMAAQSKSGSGRTATHVAVAPEVNLDLMLLKDPEGQYLRVVESGRVWNMPIVEDINLSVTSEGKTNGGILVYSSSAATWYTSEENELTIGTTGTQFIENQRTLLAESENALMVTHPKSFVYFANAVVSQ